ASLPPDEREALAARAARSTEACPALEGDGRCAIYPFRPVICRTHGLPIRFPGSTARARSLPQIDACPKNFGGRDLASLPGDAVLAQATVSPVLGALDAARADEAGRPRGERVELSTLLSTRPAAPR